MAHRDRRAVDQAMANCDLTGLADRSTATLSGGELARVHIARALASEAPILLADEPVAALDPRHQLAIMRLLRQSVDKGGAALVVLHDLGLAARFADRMIGMKQGRIMIDALPDELVSPHWIKQLFGVEATVNSEHGWPQPAIL
jgi:iron complex transport system ATP-binding protein